ncbi:DUF1707 domain-containing protein [Streptomyces sp. NPDC049944]
MPPTRTRGGVVELREEAADRRIDLDESGERLEVALTARTQDDLAPLASDCCPSVMPSAQPQVVQGESPVRCGPASGASLRGSRPQADSAAPGSTSPTDRRLRDVEVEVDGQAGGVEIVVPDGWAVETAQVESGRVGPSGRSAAHSHRCQPTGSRCFRRRTHMVSWRRTEPSGSSASQASGFRP